MANNYSSTPEIFEEVLLEEEVAVGWNIILYNDQVNTFDWVIDCLVKYCKHHSLQAEQCAWIVHTKGKCSIKNGDLDDLKPIFEALLDCGLSVKLEN